MGPELLPLRRNAVGEGIPVKICVVTDLGPTTATFAQLGCTIAPICPKVLPRIVTNYIDVVPRSAFHAVQQHISGGGISLLRRRTEHPFELPAMPERSAVDGDVIDRTSGSRCQLIYTHGARELRPGRAAQDRVLLPFFQFMALRRMRNIGSVKCDLGPEVLNDCIVPTVAYLVAQDEVVPRLRRLKLEAVAKSRRRAQSGFDKTDAIDLRASGALG